MADLRSVYDGSTQDNCSGVGFRPQYSMIICEEVGLHQASPPLSYSGYWPLWISCE